MSEVNGKIYEWLGKEPTYLTMRGTALDQNAKPFLDYWHSNAAAIELLPVLVERGYHYQLRNEAKKFIEFGIWDNPEDSYMISVSRPTISEAVTAAILQLIEREK